MIGSRQGAESFPKDPKKHAKAHIDCSRGINDTTLLAACMDAKEKKGVEEALEVLYSSIFCSKSDNKSVPTRKTVVKPSSSRHLCIGANPSSTTIQLETVLGTIYREMSDDFKSPNIVLWEELPEWVAETLKRVFAEVFKATVNLDQEQFEEKKHTNDTGNFSVPDENCPANDQKAYFYIFNVVAILICLDSMGVREVSCSPLPMIYNTFESSSRSNVLADLLRGMIINPAKTTHFDETTPPASVLSTAIGIALLRVLTGANASRSALVTPMVLQKHGCGIDDEDTNLNVSIVVGFTEDRECGGESRGANSGVGHSNSSMRENCLFRTDHVAHLETNLDDISGESLAFAIEMLLQHGAIDAWVTPIVMKKGRPAHTLHCLCKDNSDGDYDDDSGNDKTTLDALLELIFVHTSTLGIRIYRKVPRSKLDRSMITVTTPFVNTSRKGRVDVKVSRFKNGQIVRKKAEFDHCKEIAIDAGVGIQVVADEAIKEYDNRSSNM